MTDLIRNGERLDDLHRNNYKIIQSPQFFSFGLDAVLLSAFAKIGKREKCLDLCCGNGIVPILLAARFPDADSTFCGIEIQKELADMAARSVALNGLENRISIVHGDIKDGEKIFGHGVFDVITANPPYIELGGGLENISEEKNLARHELACTLEDVCQSASRLLRFGGQFYMVHRPNRLADIVSALRKFGLEPKLLRFIQPAAGREPNTLLIMAAKGGKAFLRVEAPLIVYGEDSKYTREVYDIYYG